MRTLACCLLLAASMAVRADEFISNLKSGKSQTIVTYGTSLTAGGAWVKQLQAALDKKFPGLAKVVNSGGSGMCSKWGVDNLDKRVIEKKPDAVFIEFAINDAFLKYEVSVEGDSAATVEVTRPCRVTGTSHAKRNGV